MIISSQTTHSREKFYENEDLRTLVDISIDLVNSDFFDDVLSLFYISRKKEKFFNRFEQVERHEHDDLDLETKQKCLSCISKIYDNEKDLHHLRGAFLELLTSKVVNNIYYPDESDLDCNVFINDLKSYKTVDVYAKNLRECFVCECKIKHHHFDFDDIENLQWLYNMSEGFISPFLITLDPPYPFERKIKRIIKDNKDKIDLDIFSLISIENFRDFCNQNYS